MNSPFEIGEKEGYKVKLSNFEGPLDLLLFLIRKEEIDIYDIPIASITKQYLEYIDLMKELDLEVAGEFILMAATLIQIKVRMLLPKAPEEVEELEDDPRADLVRRLIEYKRYKEVADSLCDMETRQQRFFPRSDFGWGRELSAEGAAEEEVLQDASLFDLLTAFKYVLDHMPKIDSHTVGSIGVTIEDQISFMKNRVAEKKRVLFRELMGELRERVTIIVTFMAILELIRTHQIRVQQAELFGEIWIVHVE